VGGKNPQSPGSHVILYDGVCGLCNRLNLFVLKHDKQAHFRFASLQSATGQALLRKYGRHPEALDTFYVIADFGSGAGSLAERARAALFVMKVLGSPWSWAGVFRVLPDRLLDSGYDFVARHRYRIFGKTDRCMLPSIENQDRFIDV